MLLNALVDLLDFKTINFFFIFTSFLSLYNQQLAHQQAVFNSIRNQAYGGGGDGAAYGGAAYGGAGSFAGGSTGSFGGAGPAGNYGGTYGGNSHTPNYASAGGAVGNGYQQQHANIYPANAVSFADCFKF